MKINAKWLNDSDARALLEDAARACGMGLAEYLREGGGLPIMGGSWLTRNTGPDARDHWTYPDEVPLDSEGNPAVWGIDPATNESGWVPAPRNGDGPDDRTVGEKRRSPQRLIDMISGKGRGDTGVVGRFMDAADRLHGVATGENDPWFAWEENRQLGGVNEQFSRRGLGFSSASANAANRVRQDLGGQRLARRDAAGQMELDTLSAAVETAAIPAELEIANLAATNAGLAVGGGGSGGGGLFNTVICTLLYRRGDLPRAIYLADIAYGEQYVSVDTLRGYHCWARPLVRLADRSPAIYALVRFLGWHWAHHMAHLTGAPPEPDWIGALLLHTVAPACTVLGRGLRRWRAWCRRHAIVYSES